MPAAEAFRARGAADLRAIDEGFMTEGITPLSDILEQAEPTGPVRDEQGRFAPQAAAEPEPQATTGEQEQAPAPAEVVPPTPNPEPEPGQVPLAALKGEREKRQRLEQELEALRAQLTQPQPQYQPQPQPQYEAADEVPDPVIDPAGYADWVENRALARINTQRVAQSAQSARGRHSDFDQAVLTFQQMAQLNPMLEQMMLQQPDPAEWAYRTAKTHLEVSQYGSLEDAVQAKVQAALAEKMAAIQQQAAQVAIPASLANERNVGSRTNPVPWNGPRPIGDILSR